MHRLVTATVSILCALSTGTEFLKGQAYAEVQAASELSVSAWVHNFRDEPANVPKGKKLDTPTFRHAAAMKDLGYSSAASVSFQSTKLSNGGLDFLFENTASTNNANVSRSQLGAQTQSKLLVTLRAKTLMAGTLTMILDRTGPAFPSSIDVDADGSPELSDSSGRRTATRYLTIGPNGVRILLSSSAMTRRLAPLSKSEVRLVFTPNQGPFKVLGTPCGTGALEASLQSDLLRLRAWDFPQGGKYEVLAIGTRNPNMVLPTGCKLHTDLQVSVGVFWRFGRYGELRVRLPSPLPRGVFTTQYLISTGDAWRTSNGIEIRL
jgi:hypothetical protein